MIMLTKEQLADLLRESFKLGSESAEGREYWWISTEVFHDARERAIQPLVHRSSGHDDHGREVKPFRTDLPAANENWPEDDQ